jgi:hypothetical protein
MKKLRKKKDHGTWIGNKEMKILFVGMILVILFLTVVVG